MTMKERCIPTWMPPDGTVLAVAAGEHRDAVVVPQTTGLAVLSLLDASTRHTPGPGIWDTGRQPKLYASAWADSRTSDEEARQVLVTAEQMEGLACLRCGSTEAPLHPGPAITTRVADGVVSTTVSVVCTPCLVVR
ncbi:hypothetical protein [Kitasatospora sp. MAP5-34]|uniref:hypothetical protein n=1 Tax=Kitasatospora sp. MAP5-34 TaxID=3035102 RepID=UPI00247422CD|nr:hypothetical protein [Kitasatospora sp. MAP5-34]MDH6576613.1 hypothetical protein [Kitasatospora sp. MAP5-34]